MNEWKLDSRTGDDVIHHIKEIAANYTPEWNFNPDDPDIGSALAFVYADMLEGTIEQLNRVGYKNQLAFFNQLGAGLGRSIPAKGYVSFQLADDAPTGTEVDTGMRMTADVEDEQGGSIQYETEDDIYVTPAQPGCLFLTNGQTDAIYQIAENLQEQKEPVVLFREKGENLQAHELYLAHDEVFEIFGEAYLELGFYVRDDQPLEKKYLEALTDSQIAVFSYWSDGKWQDFAEVSLLQEKILLHKQGTQPSFAKMEFANKDNYVIRCRIFDINSVENIAVEEIRLQSNAARLAPQYIYGASEECNQQEYFPFGQRLSPFEEVYFGSREALGKRGAQISLSFNLDFVQIPLETNPEEESIEWKWVMKRSDFKSNPEFDITIEEVIWEYFNGNGWSRLFPDMEYSDVFGIRQGELSQHKTIRFTCPQDMAPILVNSCDTCYIRARILKVNNLFKSRGQYVVPVLGNTTFAYSYQEQYKLPEAVCVNNNLERSMFSGRMMAEDTQKKHLFEKIEEMEKTLYLGFEVPPVGTPVRMLLLLEDTLFGQRGSICWEYYRECGWKEMNLADETCSLSRSGVVTFVGQEDFCKRLLFGKELYWIRLRDESGFYAENMGQKHYPVLKSLCMNAVGIRHMEREETEYFTLDYSLEDCSVALMHGNIDEISVEIQEGDGEKAWFQLWQEVEDLDTASAADRVYQLDRAKGIVYFGNGNHGKIPPFGREEGIRIHYKCAGGKLANVGPGQVNRLNQTLGFVNKVHNPVGLWGGLDVETPREALGRYGAKLRHWNRAVTARDYEELAMEASRVLKKVRCFGGKNEQGDKENGAVTLVVMPQQNGMDKSQICSVQQTIYQYLSSRMDPGIVERKQFYVIGPKMVEVKVIADVVVSSFQDVFQVRRKAQERIARFLDPMKGHFDGGGWEIGQFPNAMQIQNAIKEIEEIVQIRKVYLVTFVSGPKGRQEVTPEVICNHPYILPFSGTHEIMVNVKGI